ncbi:MAG: efflux RND transporter periplasmic adaptor subunit [Synechococcus sp.]
MVIRRFPLLGPFENGPLVSKLGFTALLAVAVTLGGCGGGQQGASGPPPLPVSMMPLDIGEHEASSDFVGNLEASDRVLLAPQISGRIVQIYTEEGTPVAAGTPIFLLNPEQTQAAVDSANATINAREAELQASEADRARVAAELRLAEIEAERYISLADDGAVSFETRDRFVRDLEVQQANLKAADDDVSAARKRLLEAQAQLDAVQVDLDYKEVKSPIAGIVGDIPFRVGDVVNVGQSLTTITQNDRLELNVRIPANRLPQLKMGLPVELIDFATDEVVTTGGISFINPRIDQGNQTVLVKFFFPNTGDLKDDQFVRARVIWNTAPGILVPARAISRLGTQAFVFVVGEGDSQQVARQRPVTLGAIQGQSYQVLSGLKEGDVVITSKILDLVDGRPITEAASASSNGSEAEDSPSSG